jgi:hypothetical protein
VCLNAGGTLSGSLVDPQGIALSGQPVELWTKGANVARTLTGAQGQFEFHQLRTGVYQVLAPGTGGAYRVWQPHVAPPAARQSLLLVQGPLVRGQNPYCRPGIGAGVYDGTLTRVLGSPWVLAGAVGTGIALPIALDNADGS